MNAHVAAVLLHAKEDHARRLARFLEERSTALAQNLPFRKHTPRDTHELSWATGYHNDYAPIHSSILAGYVRLSLSVPASSDVPFKDAVL